MTKPKPKNPRMHLYNKRTGEYLGVYTGSNPPSLNEIKAPAETIADLTIDDVVIGLAPPRRKPPHR